jgi:predicted signal transduction protein with EAL and GGDEF domain
MYETALHARSVARLRLENELHGALARSELLLHWQPVVRGRRLVAGAEALVRWHHRTAGCSCRGVRAARRGVRPHPLDRRMDLRARAVAGGRLAAHAPRALLDRGERVGAGARPARAYLEKVGRALRANALEPSSLELEVTERVLMSSLDENIETLRRLGELGVRILDRRLRHRLLEPRVPAPASRCTS